jgi:hypothetical protein
VAFLYTPHLNSRAKRQGFAKKNTLSITHRPPQADNQLKNGEEDFFSANPQGAALTVSPGDQNFVQQKACGE